MAIYGIGTDLAQVSRIAAVLERTGGRFAEKVLGPDELRVFHARRARSEARGIAFLATRFSAKEAFSKAIGLGMHWPMTWRALQTLNRPSGEPYVVASGELAAWLEGAGGRPPRGAPIWARAARTSRAIFRRSAKAEGIRRREARTARRDGRMGPRCARRRSMWSGEAGRG